MKTKGEVIRFKLEFVLMMLAAIDPAVDEALLDFMARRKGSFEDRDY